MRNLFNNFSHLMNKVFPNNNSLNLLPTSIQFLVSFARPRNLLLITIFTILYINNEFLNIGLYPILIFLISYITISTLYPLIKDYITKIIPLIIEIINDILEGLGGYNNSIIPEGESYVSPDEIELSRWRASLREEVKNSIDLNMDQILESLQNIWNISIYNTLTILISHILLSIWNLIDTSSIIELFYSLLVLDWTIDPSVWLSATILPLDPRPPVLDKTSENLKIIPDKSKLLSDEEIITYILAEESITDPELSEEIRQSVLLEISKIREIESKMISGLCPTVEELKYWTDYPIPDDVTKKLDKLARENNIKGLREELAHANNSYRHAIISDIIDKIRVENQLKSNNSEEQLKSNNTEEISKKYIRVLIIPPHKKNSRGIHTLVESSEEILASNLNETNWEIKLYLMYKIIKFIVILSIYFTIYASILNTTISLDSIPHILEINNGEISLSVIPSLYFFTRRNKPYMHPDWKTVLQILREFWRISDQERRIQIAKNSTIILHQIFKNCKTKNSRKNDRDWYNLFYMFQVWDVSNLLPDLLNNWSSKENKYMCIKQNIENKSLRYYLLQAIVFRFWTLVDSSISRKKLIRKIRIYLNSETLNNRKWPDITTKMKTEVSPAWNPTLARPSYTLNPVPKREYHTTNLRINTRGINTSTQLSDNTNNTNNINWQLKLYAFYKMLKLTLKISTYVFIYNSMISNLTLNLDSLDVGTERIIEGYYELPPYPPLEKIITSETSNIPFVVGLMESLTEYQESELEKLSQMSDVDIRWLNVEDRVCDLAKITNQTREEVMNQFLDENPDLRDQLRIENPELFCQNEIEATSTPNIPSTPNNSIGEINYDSDNDTNMDWDINGMEEYINSNSDDESMWSYLPLLIITTANPRNIAKLRLLIIFSVYVFSKIDISNIIELITANCEITTTSILPPLFLPNKLIENIIKYIINLILRELSSIISILLLNRINSAMFSVTMFGLFKLNKEKGKIKRYNRVLHSTTPSDIESWNDLGLGEQSTNKKIVSRNPTEINYSTDSSSEMTTDSEIDDIIQRDRERELGIFNPPTIRSQHTITDDSASYPTNRTSISRLDLDNRIRGSSDGTYNSTTHSPISSVTQTVIPNPTVESSIETTQITDSHSRKNNLRVQAWLQKVEEENRKIQTIPSEETVYPDVNPNWTPEQQIDYLTTQVNRLNYENKELRGTNSNRNKNNEK